jgi:hypothetical protein
MDPGVLIFSQEIDLAHIIRLKVRKAFFHRTEHVNAVSKASGPEPPNVSRVSAE